MLPSSLKWLPILILPIKGLLGGLGAQDMEQYGPAPPQWAVFSTLRWKPLPLEIPEVAEMVQWDREGAKKWRLALISRAPSQGNHPR